MEEVLVRTNPESIVAVSSTTNTVSLVDESSYAVTEFEKVSSTVVTTTDYLVVETPVSTTVVTGMIGPTGPAGINEDDIVYAKRVDFISDNELYRGEAAVGSTEGSSSWRIRKITIGTDGDVTEVWANGNASFDKAWADRLTYTYS